MNNNSTATCSHHVGPFIYIYSTTIASYFLAGIGRKDVRKVSLGPFLSLFLMNVCLLQIVGDAVGWGFVVRGNRPCHIQAVEPCGPAAAAGMKVGIMGNVVIEHGYSLGVLRPQPLETKRIS